MKKVFVSGCFDMLHSGHAAFLEEAASHGELYVGLGSDSTIMNLKGRAPVNSEAERLYMVKALRCVKDAWINSGSGLLDFEKEVSALSPDIFFVNSDGFTPGKEKFCRARGMELIVSRRLPHPGLPPRSTTALRSECRIPYRLEICGGWMDQPFVNSLAPGAVVTLSIEPEFDCNDRAGMATSSRKRAIELWRNKIPAGDPEKLAEILFCVDNPPGKKIVSGSQDALGIVMPGLNFLHYDNGYWPDRIESALDLETLAFVEEHLFLLPLSVREDDYDAFGGMRLSPEGAERIAASSEKCWKAILARDTAAWGTSMNECFEAQTAMFPAMLTREIAETAGRFRPLCAGLKMTGAGGGGYMLVVSEKPFPNGVRIHARI